MSVCTLHSPVLTSQYLKTNITTLSILLFKGEDFITDVPGDCSRQSESLERVLEALSGMTDLTSLLAVSIALNIALSIALSIAYSSFLS